eukprot:NODE_1511_length_1505_cov_119.859890_g1364_i0.p1 GENE.NODE_1511_length_1505_cov_119.859890_g1364_i0~~NODE_1511_length_1505_cov_119.859890_g1364_i0.p1  ORF type:complete len:252 (+),score=38.41 NODE_1511_length_1505_cov_119.859890_g1364_i0:104-859(+)
MEHSSQSGAAAADALPQTPQFGPFVLPFIPMFMPPMFFMFPFPGDMFVPEMEPAGPPPTSKEALDALQQSVKALDENDILNASACCAVCQDDFHVGDRGLWLPCRHLFHDECVMPWLQQHNTCPMCRHSLPSGKPGQEPGQRPQPTQQSESEPHAAPFFHFFYPPQQPEPHAGPNTQAQAEAQAQAHSRRPADEPTSPRSPSSGMFLDDLGAMSIRELLFHCRRLGINTSGALEKADLVELLQRWLEAHKR